MRLIRGAFSWIRSLRDLHGTLKPYPGHFRKLLFSFTRNVSKLAVLKLRTRLTGKKLVVIALAERMGDIVACEPFSRQVESLHPDDYILWVVRPGYLELVKGNTHLDGILSIECVTEWIWLRRLGVFDRAYDLHINGKHCLMCHCYLWKVDGQAEINMSNYYDYGSLLGSFSRSAGSPMDEGDPVVYIDSDVRDSVDRLDLPRRYITIHATSEDDIRNWEVSKWNQLIGRIIDTHGVAVIELGLRSFLNRPDGEGYINLCGRCGVLETAEVIRRSLLFIGIDSGPAHLANAVKTSGLLLLGKYFSFEEYMPYSGFYSDPAHCRIIRSERAVTEISAEQCLSAVAEFAHLSEERPESATQLGSP